jgi:hypothetical protein
MQKTLIALLLLSAPAFSQDIRSSRDLIESMHARYSGKWYPNVTFAQAAIFYKDGKVEKEEVWYEAISAANGLLIKQNDINGGNGVMYSGDSQYVWRDNRIVARRKRQNDLFVLGFSVYSDDPAVTITKLKAAGYDFDKFEKVVTDSTTEYIVGEKGGPRFWIDGERLVFKKLQQKNAEGKATEIQFNDYEQLRGGWIATEVLFMTEGQLTLKEIYRDIKTPKKMPFQFNPRVDFVKVKW